MATAPSVSLFNTDPNIQAQAALLAQRQAMAQKLMEEGMKPIETGNRQVGGVGYHVSPMEGLAKMLQAYTGQQGVQQTTAAQAKLAAQAYGNLLGRYQPGEGASYSPAQMSGASAAGMEEGMGPPDPAKMAAALQGQAPANTGVNPNNPTGIPPQLLAQRDAGMMSDEAFKALVAPYMATDATKAAIQGGMDPTQANRQAFAKTNTDPKILGMRQAGLTEDQIKAAMGGAAQKDATLAARPDQSIYSFNGTGQPSLSAVAPNPGSNMQFQVGPEGSVTAQPVPGANANRASMTAATEGAGAGAKAPHQVIELWDPDQQRMVKVYAGNVLPPAGGSPGARINPAVQATRDAEALRILEAERKKPTNSPEDNAALDREIARARKGASGAAPAGASLGEADQIKDMTTRFSALREQNTQAQPTISYLESIRTMAPKAATGQFADRLQFVNSLLSPFSEKANDATTATNLLDKYSNQIVTRLGQGGLGTDAARAIISSAYPNKHMNVAAIGEAVDNLVGAQRMVQAKTSLLAPLHNSRDTAKYQQTEQQFDQLADPRIWQLQFMDANTAKQFLSKMPAAEQQSLRQRATALKNMGAL